MKRVFVTQGSRKVPRGRIGGYEKSRKLTLEREWEQRLFERQQQVVFRDAIADLQPDADVRPTQIALVVSCGGSDDTEPALARNPDHIFLSTATRWPNAWSQYA